MPKPSKTARSVQPNKGIEVAYRARLDALVKEMANSLEYWLSAEYKQNPPRMAKAIEIAEDASPVKAMKARLKKLTRRWLDKFDQMSSAIAEKFVDSGVKYTDTSFKSSLKDAGWTVEFKMTPLMKDAASASIQENVSLIKSIAQQHLSDVEGIVMRGYAAGNDLGSVSKELQERYGVTKRRAALIARDQSNKLNATTTQARRVELGLFRAVWMHSGAGKEPRPSHVKAGREKLEFDVRTGAYIDGEYILPGQKIGCRCSSKTILPF